MCMQQDLQQLADQFTQKKSKGLALAHGSGYGGSGFKFDEHEEDERKALRKVCASLVRCSPYPYLPSLHRLSRKNSEWKMTANRMTKLRSL